MCVCVCVCVWVGGCGCVRVCVCMRVYACVRVRVLRVHVCKGNFKNSFSTCIIHSYKCVGFVGTFFLNNNNFHGV